MTNTPRRLGSAALLLVACGSLLAGAMTGVARANPIMVSPAEQEAALAEYRDLSSLYAEGISKREQTRSAELAEASDNLDDHLKLARTTTKDDVRFKELSESLRHAVELQVLYGKSREQELLNEPRIRELVRMADKAAHEAESRGQWLLANELFFRLNVLFEQEMKYEADVDRLSSRLSMIRLYVPKTLWELTNERRVLDGEDPLPEYNPFGDTFDEKLSPIDDSMVRRAIERAAFGHLDHTGMKDLITHGLDAIETFATTTDLADAFPGLRDARQREAFLAEVNSLRREVEGLTRQANSTDLRKVVYTMLLANDRTIKVMEQALLHEFGNGSMAALDKYTGIIWPDEVKRFERSTRGAFVGVGIQIEMDDLYRIRVVTPLEGTPAQRAGISTGDIITKVNGRSTVGFTLDQAVEVITGPQGTDVTVTVERGEDEDKQVLDFRLDRKRIDLPTVNGWHKIAPGDEGWDWFIDRDAGIGYIRLTSFAENTTEHFDRAIAAMRAERELNGLVLDLRFNPGGLLDQAVSIANRFVDRGLIVKTEDVSGIVRQREMASPISRGSSLVDLPVVVLINNGSASASEIVSGAIQAHAREGNINAWLVGENTFGKGSVQNVFGLDRRGLSMMKLTTQYYKLRDDRMIHRLPGATEWGVKPDIEVEMLPEQIVDALKLRRDSDVLEIDRAGNVIPNADRPDPDRLITEGIDLQLQRALVKLHEARAGKLITQLQE